MTTPRHVAAALVLAVAAPTSSAQATWRQLYPATGPSWRNDFAMAYDGARGGVVLYGGRDLLLGNSRLDDLWEWSGTGWSQVSVAGARPSARSGHGLVFDSARGRMVLFSGDSGGYETWELLGDVWTLRAPVHVPSALRWFGMTFDARRARVVLFGGQASGAGSLLDETWEYDGVDWALQNPATRPTARARTQLVYDPQHRECVLFGGETRLPATLQLVQLNDTWTWDGLDWRRRQPANAPAVAAGHRMVYDHHRERVVMQGGLRDAFAWEWDGDNWSIALTSPPGIQVDHGLAYDALRREVLLCGTQLQIAGGTGDTWVYRTNDPARFTSFAAGCADSAGVPELAAAEFGLPWLGDTMRTRVVVPGASAIGAVFVTGLAQTPGQSLAGLGMPGCSGFVTDDDVVFKPLVAGVAEFDLAVPPIAALLTVSLYQQALILDPGAPGGAAVSNACVGRVGLR